MHRFCTSAHSAKKPPCASGGQHAVHHEAVRAVSEQVQVEEVALRLLHHHLLGQRHDAHGGALGIFEQLLQLDEPRVEPLDVRHGAPVGQLQLEQLLRQGREHPQGHLARRQPLLQVPAEQLRELEQRERLAGGRAVHDDAVIRAALREVDELEQGEQAVHARHRRHLPVVGVPAHAGSHRQGRAHERAVLLLHDAVGVELDGIEVLRHAHDGRADAPIEHVAHAVRRVGAGQQRAMALGGELERARRRDARLAHAALPRENPDARHASSFLPHANNSLFELLGRKERPPRPRRPRLLAPRLTRWRCASLRSSPSPLPRARPPPARAGRESGRAP